MTNRMKPLLAMYDANRNAIEKIASKRLDESGEYERMRKQLDGRGFVRGWRRREMALIPDQVTATRIIHHIRQAEELLTRRRNLIEEPFAKKACDEPHPRSHRCRLIRELPNTLLDRLEPVFSQSDLFDPERRFEKQFDVWHKSFESQLDQAERNIEKGKGYQTRRFTAYREIFAREYPAIEVWFDELYTLIVAARATESSSHH